MVFTNLLNDERIVGEKQDMALMQEPEEIGGELGGRRGAAFRQDSFPESFEFCGFVRTNPLDHDAGPLGERGP